MNFARIRNLCLTVVVALAANSSDAAERIVLTATNWDAVVPDGKEVDAIYGDVVIRNELIVAVVANPIAGRNANMTVQDVAGSIIDLTRRAPMSDQLSCFYATAKAYSLREIPDGDHRATVRSDTVEYQVRAAASEGKPEVTVTYKLADGQPFIQIESAYKNPHDVAIEVELLDSMRADKGFRFGTDERTGTFWAYDSWWKQAYGVVSTDRKIQGVDDSVEKLRPLLAYADGDQTSVTLKPGETFKLVRKLIPGDGQLQVLAIARQILGQQTHPCRVAVTDPSGPITAAYVTVYSMGKEYASATTKSNGAVEFGLPPGEYRVRTRGPGRKDAFRQLNVSDSVSLDVKMAAPGYVNASITDDNDQPIPAKVDFKGRNGTRDPYYGPDTYEFAVQNLRYTHNGVFRLPIAPGDYDVIISHGPEYDAVFKSISVNQNEEFSLTAKLRHSVDTTGWVSSDYHSHSTPSGDNTSSQKGRVLNLLAEHIEFAPCTEHNRISSYMSHIRELDALHLMATCSGMEVTGKPLPVNHHNVFPLVLKSRTQDGGGPPTDLDPVAQIERIALWDAGSDKLIQQDHPNLVQIFGDRDEDGKPDEGFAKMFGFMDVVEVHPPGMIFSRPNAEEGDWKNTMFRWMQLLNQGYRIPGVVNTDAHYNYHGSGWLRNYVRSSTDNPSEIDTMEMVRASERGNLVMTNGPFLGVSANSGGRSAIAGDDLVAAKNHVTLHVRVQCPNWLDINRVQVFVNGRPESNLNFTRSANSEMFSTDTVKFDQKISVDVSADAHLIVATAGEGLNLGPVYGADRGKAMPVAVANPIFVDVDGNGFQANGDLLDASLPGK